MARDITRPRILLAIGLTAVVVPAFSAQVAMVAAANSGATAEVRINTTTSGDQDSPDVASDAVGNYVVAWTSNGQDGGGLAVYAQRYDAAGTARGPETRVNTTTAADQHAPSVAMDADGDYVITWTSNAQDGSGDGVYAQRYNAAGTAQGIETRVNTTTLNGQNQPSAAMDADGNYVITWTSQIQDGSGFGIYAQRYTAAGTVNGVETRINTTTGGDQSEPSAAMDADGNYVITWTSNLQDGSLTGVYAQHYNRNGTLHGTETGINTTTTDDQDQPSVAMDADGDYVITWTSDLEDGSFGGIYAQRYSADDKPQGTETRINTTTFDDQTHPSVAMDADGSYVVTWTSNHQDGSALGVYSRRYNAAGTAQSTETRVNTTVNLSQSESAVALDADGDAMVTWTSILQDGGGDGVYGRRFRGPEPVDLQLSQSDNADPIAVGGRLVYRIRVTNQHEPATDTGVAAIDDAIGAATGVRVLVTPPDDAVLTSSTGTGWSCGAPGATFSCGLASPLPADGAAPTLVLVYDAPGSAGTFQQTARVSDRHTDPVTTDNTEVERTGVMCSIEFAHPSYSKSEFSTITATVTRHGTNCDTSSVQYDTNGGTATAGADFAVTSGVLTWADADTVKTFAVPLVDDALDEDTERFTLALTNPAGALLAHNRLITGFVGDNDDPPRINFTTAATAATEATGLVELTVRLSAVSGKPVTVDLARSGTATNGADYVPPTNVTIPAGQRAATFDVEIVDDGATEVAETAILTLTNPNGGTIGSVAIHRITIAASD